MRTHPLGIMCIERSLPETIHIAISFSLITHADPRCVIACVIVTTVIRGILRGELCSEAQLDQLIDQCWDLVSQWHQRKRLFGRETTPDRAIPEDDLVQEPSLNRQELNRHIEASGFEQLELDDARKIGYVYKALGASILALRFAMRHSNGTRERGYPPEKYTRPGTNMFEELITDLVMQGGDADTNACTAGALLGAWFGYSTLPLHWRDGLDHGPWLIQKCTALQQVLGIGKESGEVSRYDGTIDKDTLPDGGIGLLTKEELDSRAMKFMETYLHKADLVRKQKQSKNQGWLKSVFK